MVSKSQRTLAFDQGEVSYGLTCKNTEALWFNIAEFNFTIQPSVL